MQASVRRLLDRVIDYAGMFPPAALSLGEAVREYTEWTSGPNAFLVGRFCCPAASLLKLLAFLPQAGQSAKLPISVIGAASEDVDQWESSRAAEARAMTDFQTSCEAFAEIQAYEVRIPSNKEADRFFGELQGFSTVDIFAELLWDENVADAIAAAADHEWISVKGRTGGGLRTPSTGELAQFLWNGASLEIPFKLTGGLHHPVTTGSESGFINVLTALALCYSADYGPASVTEVLECSDGSAWQFGDEGFRWKGEQITIEDIDQMRAVFAGFGSCSLTEPWEGLVAQGWA